MGVGGERSIGGSAMKIKVERVNTTSDRRRVLDAAHEQELQRVVDDMVLWLTTLEDPLDAALVLAMVQREVNHEMGVSKKDTDRAALVVAAKQWNPGN